MLAFMDSNLLNSGALYTKEDRHIMRVASDSLNPKVDRVEELKAFAREAGMKSIGIAHCIALKAEAQQLKQELVEAGFKVFSADCKFGKVPFTEIVEGYKGVSCNPAGQAKYLENKHTELNIMMGLCVGHDMVFNAKSAAPVTPLLVKDRKHKHHPRQHFLEQE
jgi:uncharacterized metal-binding protein